MKIIGYTKLIIKNTIAYLLYLFGVLYLIGNTKLKNKAIVLMYHRVLPYNLLEQSFSSKGILVSDKVFKKHLKFLSKKFEVVTLEGFKSFLTGKSKSSKPVCLITFDDGWFDNYEYAFPLLSKYNLPATIFLTYNYINTIEPFWQEKLNRVIRIILGEKNQLEKKDFFLKLIDTFLMDKNIFTNLLDENICINELFQFLKTQKYSKIQKFLDYFELNGVNFYPDVFFSWDQITEMLNSGISFGSHGLTHKILTNLSDDDKRQEIIASKSKIGQKLKNEINTFSYPNGDFNEQTIAFIKESAYELAFTTVNGYVKKFDSQYELKRINIHNNNSLNIPLLYSTILDVF